MSMKRITSAEVAEPQPETWSNCKVVGNFIQVAGMVSGYQDDVIAGGDDVYEQARLTFTKIKHMVEAAGAVMDDIIKVTIFVTDITRREEVWKARREFFTGDFPCSTLVEVSALARPGLAVEIEAYGIIGASQ
jgi:enamine deaminase RidA (YjgF/YER057c/UK114 family)